MKNKGFTLVELLAVLIIIGVIAMIAVPAVGGVINSSKKGASEEQKNRIISAARTYMAQNSMELPNSDEQTCISITKLKDKGLLTNEEIKNPNDNSNLNGKVIITNTNNKYDYKYEEGTCE